MAGKARKIRLYPTKQEKETLLRWIGAARWTYNRCVEAVRSEDVPRNKKALRAVALNRDAPDLPAWLHEVPYDVRDEGMNDLLKAYTTNFAKKKANTQHRFEVRFRSRKRLSQESVVVHAKHWKKTSGAYAFLKSMRSAEGPLPDDIRYDTRLVCVRRTQEFYLCVLSPLEVRGENQAPASRRVIALDPGVRTFQTGYDPEGVCVEWGRRDIGRVYRLCHALDKLQARIDTGGHRRRWSRRRAAARLRQKIRDLVDDLHRKAAKWLCEEYAVVLLPEFETSRMVLRSVRRLGSKTARAMVTWAHYRFRQRLLSKAREYPWSRVVLVNEAYTSKTCGRCGVVNRALGGRKVFRCPACGLEADRDLHAARNILLRYLTTTPDDNDEQGTPSPALRPTSSRPTSLDECMNRICCETDKCGVQM
jgi:putative transposase